MNAKNNWPVPLFQIFSLFTLGGMTAVYLSHLGEPNPVETITNLLTSGYALLATWLAIAVWTFLEQEDQSRRQWAILTIGFGLWTMAELLWAFLSHVMEETPYPSPADAFWVPGYVMVLFAATLRYRSLKIQWNSRTAQALLGVFAVLFVFVLVLIILPILLASGWDDWLASLLNIFYPIADLLVLFGALLLALSFSGGRFSTPWAALSAGLAMLSLSDILFTYSDWHGLYTPDGHLTWMTAIVDMGNLTAYILIAYGVLLNYQLIRVGRATEQHDSPQSQSPTQPLRQPHVAETQKVMIFVDDTDRVVFANYNLARFLLADNANVIGMPLSQALGLSPQDAQLILNSLHAPRIGSTEKYITQYRANDAQVTGWLRGQANFNDLREYTGADITCDVESWPNSGVTHKSKSSFVVAPHTLVFDSLEGKLLLDYFSHKVHVLQQAVSQMGGGTVVGVFGEGFLSASGREGCLFSLEDGAIRVEKLPARPEAYARILATLTAYARDTLSIELVSGIFRRLDEDSDPETLAAAQKFGLV